MSTALVPVADIEKMAGAIAKSKMFGMKTADEAFALMLIAQAEGMHPAIAARDFHVGCAIGDLHRHGALRQGDQAIYHRLKVGEIVVPLNQPSRNRAFCT